MQSYLLASESAVTKNFIARWPGQLSRLSNPLTSAESHHASCVHRGTANFLCSRTLSPFFCEFGFRFASLGPLSANSRHAGPFHHSAPQESPPETETAPAFHRAGPGFRLQRVLFSPLEQTAPTRMGTADIPPPACTHPLFAQILCREPAPSEPRKEGSDQALNTSVLLPPSHSLACSPACS